MMEVAMRARVAITTITLRARGCFFMKVNTFVIIYRSVKYLGANAWRFRYLGGRSRSWWVSRLITAGFVVTIVGLIGGIGLFAYIARDLPSPDRVVRREGFSTRIYDRDGELLYDVFADQRRTPVSFDQMPLPLRQATIAIEDKNFYTHQGFDPLGIIRGALRSVFTGRLQSGSTLTQQLVKNTLLTPKQTLARKIRELILTIQVESKYSKDEILQMYLNESPYGGTAWGVQAASEIYFHKPIAEVNLAEAAILAGLPQSPSRYSPLIGKAYVNRAKDVLRRMREDGYVSKEEEDAAIKEVEEMIIIGNGKNLLAPHFVFYVRDELEERYGERVVEQGGLRVTTSLDLDVQEEAQSIVSEEIAKVEHLKITNGGAVVMDTLTGQILAMVGSKGWEVEDYDGKYNVTTAIRQPGSAIKPLVYLAGLRKGYTAATLLMDTRTVFPGGDKPEYVPENYDGKFRGPMLARYALGNSVNVPAVKMLSKVGIKDTLDIGFDMGFTTLEPTKETLARLGLSLALGGGEVRLLDMATAYSAFANGGKKVQPTVILKVTDSSGRILEEWKDRSARQVISAGEAFVISSILADPEARRITFGVGTSLMIPGRQVAVKTGTTNDKKDNWTVGWTANGRITGVWVGNNDNSPMREVASGVTGASPIWKRIMTAAVDDTPVTEFAVPGDVEQGEIDNVSGYPSHDGYPSRMEYFIEGTKAEGEDPVHKKIRVCKGEGKLATPADVASGNYEDREALYFKEEDPFEAQNGSNKWQEGVLGWISEQADPRYHPPTEYCGSTNPLWIIISEPGDKSRINSGDVPVKVTVTDTYKVVRVEVYLDGNLKYTLDSEPWEVTIPNVSDGIHRVDVKARDEKGFDGSRYVEIGVNQDWASPTPTP